MSYKFSRTSKKKLATAHPLLQDLFYEVIKHVDCTIIEGVRSPDRQADLLRAGKTRTLGSKHLRQEDGWSWAVDAIAYPIEWDNSARNYLFAGFVKGIAASRRIKLRMGADWDGDFTAEDQHFHDLVHFELEEDTCSTLLY